MMTSLAFVFLSLLWTIDGLARGTATLPGVSRNAFLRSLRLSPVHAAAAQTLFPLDISGGCTSSLIIGVVAEACDCLAEPFLLALLGLEENQDNVLHQRLGHLCESAWGTVETSTWQDVDETFTDSFMERFVQGETYLNLETGNLREDPVEAYPTSLASRATADNVNDFFESKLFRNTILQRFQSTSVMTAQDGNSKDNNEDLVEDASKNHHDICANTQSLMCCWGRDRQSNDGNGNCQADDCIDADPADNTNLCEAEDKDEGDVHCHGLAWSSDPNHISAVFKFNNFFYVSLYDHWYTRGYVENGFGGSLNGTGYPMCGCVDEMPMVTRADCSQVASAEITFTIDWTEESGLIIEAGPVTGLQMQACEGHVFGNQKKDASNDLASHINGLVANGNMTVSIQARNFDTLVGYGQPNNNDNEEACALAVARQQGKEKGDVQTMTSFTDTNEEHKKRRGLGFVVTGILCVALSVGVMLAIEHQRRRKSASRQHGSADY